MNRIASIAAAAALTTATLVAAPASAHIGHGGTPHGSRIGEFCPQVSSCDPEPPTCTESDPLVQMWAKAYTAERARLEAQVSQLQGKAEESRVLIQQQEKRIADSDAKIWFLQMKVRMLRDKLRAK